MARKVLAGPRPRPRPSPTVDTASFWVTRPTFYGESGSSRAGARGREKAREIIFLRRQQNEEAAWTESGFVWQRTFSQYNYFAGLNHRFLNSSPECNYRVITIFGAAFKVAK